MGRTQVKIPESVVKKYLEAKENAKVSILSYEKLGSGWHGTGYKVKFETRNPKSEVKELVLRTLMPEGFSHDFIADRAKVFVTQHEMSRNIPGHVKSYDVSGYTRANELISIGDAVEFFQVVEVAEGSSYGADFQRIKDTGVLEKDDLKKARILGEYLARLHTKTFKGTKDAEVSIRRRHSRDAIGHGEMMMGVIDTYPAGFTFISKDGLTEMICKAVRYREGVKDVDYRPCRIHGDFHPGNIIFDGNKVNLLDASRELWGDPADDVVSIALNYIWFAVMQSGEFKGPFGELFKAFWRAYFSKTAHKHILKTFGVHLAFRSVVVAHPVFYGAQTDATRKKIMKLTAKVLSSNSFDPSKIKEYLR